MVTTTLIAPRARIAVRDEEWLVRRVDPSSDGGRLLTCDGVSDLVRGQSSLFLTALEGPIEDIRHQVTGDFKERRTIKLTPQASAAEEAAYQACSPSVSPRVVRTEAASSRSCNA